MEEKNRAQNQQREQLLPSAFVVDDNLRVALIEYLKKRPLEEVEGLVNILRQLKKLEGEALDKFMKTLQTTKGT